MPGVKDEGVTVCLVIVRVISTLVICDARVLGKRSIEESIRRAFAQIDPMLYIF